jgi:hypothetical protein
MLFNYDRPPSEIEKKRLKCWEWKAQVIDCRYRPHSQLHDYYNARKSQTSDDYYIHEQAGWTDKTLKLIRSQFRRQNILIRQGMQPFHSKYFERPSLRKQQPQGLLNKLRVSSPEVVKAHLEDAWFPEETSFQEMDQPSIGESMIAEVV